VILDEVGRGTATFDGLSLAWSIVEYLHDEPAHAALVLFATHYHELTDPRQRPAPPREPIDGGQGVAWRDPVPHRVVDGPADRSYGIHVAQLAGVPAGVCDRAEQILATLERHELKIIDAPTSGPGAGPARAHPAARPVPAGVRGVADQLRRTEVERLTPLEALNLMATLRNGCPMRD